MHELSTNNYAIWQINYMSKKRAITSYRQGQFLPLA